MKKVLYLSTAYDVFGGGAEVSLYMLINSLMKRKEVKAYCATPYERFYPFPEEDVVQQGFAFKPLHRTFNPFTLFSFYKNILAVSAELKKFCIDNDIDIIHANGCKAALYAPEGVPLVCHLRDLRVPYLAARFLRKKISVAVAPSDAVVEFGRRKFCIEPLLVPNPVGFIFDEVKELAMNQLEDIKIKLAGKPFVLMAANFYWWKRHDVFLEAFKLIKKQFPDMQAVIASGLGYDTNIMCKRYVENRIKRLGLSDAVHCSFFVQWEMRELYKAASLLLHPPVAEPFGRVVAEAMLESLPVIAANSAGPAGILDEGGGILLDTPDPEGFAKAACSLLAEPEKMRQLGCEGRRIASERYSPEKHAEKIREIYQNIS